MLGETAYDGRCPRYESCARYGVQVGSLGGLVVWVGVGGDALEISGRLCSEPAQIAGLSNYPKRQFHSVEACSRRVSGVVNKTPMGGHPTHSIYLTRASTHTYIYPLALRPASPELPKLATISEGGDGGIGSDRRANLSPWTANHLRRRISRRSLWSSEVSTRWVPDANTGDKTFRLECQAAMTNGKNWKARLSAYNDVIAKSAKTASDTDPFFRPFVSDGPLLCVHKTMTRNQV